jgi:hypothetical protein
VLKKIENQIADCRIRVFQAQKQYDKAKKDKDIVFICLYRDEIEAEKRIIKLLIRLLDK